MFLFVYQERHSIRTSLLHHKTHSEAAGQSAEEHLKFAEFLLKASISSLLKAMSNWESQSFEIHIIYLHGDQTGSSHAKKHSFFCSEEPIHIPQLVSQSLISKYRQLVSQQKEYLH